MRLANQSGGALGPRQRGGRPPAACRARHPHWRQAKANDIKGLRGIVRIVYHWRPGRLTPRRWWVLLLVSEAGSIPGADALPTPAPESAGNRAKDLDGLNRTGNIGSMETTGAGRKVERR